MIHIGIKHFEKTGPEARLRLYDEMFVIRAQDQRYEYLNCRRQTGMLNAAF